MQEKVGMRCFVSGRVQGVWFRASTQDQAKKWNITGSARNLPDGRVEVIAFGEKDKLNELRIWLKVGPTLAEVTEVTYEEIPFEIQDRFAIK